MFDIIFERLRQKKRTVAYPKGLPVLPPRFRGRPFIHAEKCLGVAGKPCQICTEICPSRAISCHNNQPNINLGMCTFCGACATACPSSSIVFSKDWRLASTSLSALTISPKILAEVYKTDTGKDFPDSALSLEEQEALFLELKPFPVVKTTALKGALKRSLRLRQVSAGGCNACEADLNVLTTVVFDLMRFGIDFVASPRHADAMALTGPVARNMQEAVKKCHVAMGEPKFIMAIGACAISGGLFRSYGASSSCQSTEGIVPHAKVDLFIPGCPPNPYTSLDGFLRFIGYLE